MSRRAKEEHVAGVLLAVVIGLFALTGSHGMNTEYQPQNEFKLEDWIAIHLGGLNLSINKAVLYLFLASGLTAGTMIYIARRMQQRPNLVQTAVEVLWGVMRNNIAGPNNIDREMAMKWFPFIGTLFLFILYSTSSATCRCRSTPARRSNCSALITGVRIPAGDRRHLCAVLSLMVWAATTTRASGPRA